MKAWGEAPGKHPHTKCLRPEGAGQEMRENAPLVSSLQAFGKMDEDTDPGPQPPRRRTHPTHSPINPVRMTSTASHYLGIWAAQQRPPYRTQPFFFNGYAATTPLRSRETVTVRVRGERFRSTEWLIGVRRSGSPETAQGNIRGFGGSRSRKRERPDIRSGLFTQTHT